MAKIQRKTQKIFAGNANGDQIAVFGTMKTGTPDWSSDVEELQSVAYSQGWSDAILNDKAPYLEEMNGVQYGLSYQIAYMLEAGIPEYDSNTEYNQTDIVREPGTYKLYGSLQDEQSGHALTETSYWLPLLDLGNTVQVRVVVETYKSGARWYRLYDDNWCEQGGTNTAGSIAFSKAFVDTNYTLLAQSYSNKATSSFTLGTSGDWMAVGYIA